MIVFNIFSAGMVEKTKHLFKDYILRCPSGRSVPRLGANLGHLAPHDFRRLHQGQTRRLTCLLWSREARGEVLLHL